MGRVWTESTDSVPGLWVDCLLLKSEPLNSMKGREIRIAYIRALYSELCLCSFELNIQFLNGFRSSVM